MLLFKYPMQNKIADKLRKEIANEEDGLDQDEIEVLVQSRLLHSGLTDDITNMDEIICNDYTDEEIQ